MKATELTTEELIHGLEFAKHQRFEALKNAFKTVHEFADPSLSPDESQQLEEVEQILIDRYNPAK